MEVKRETHIKFNVLPSRKNILDIQECCVESRATWHDFICLLNARDFYCILLSASYSSFFYQWLPSFSKSSFWSITVCYLSLLVSLIWYTDLCYHLRTAMIVLMCSNDIYRRNDVFCGFTSASRWFLKYSLLLVFLFVYNTIQRSSNSDNVEFIRALGYHASTNTTRLFHHGKNFINVLENLGILRLVFLLFWNVSLGVLFLMSRKKAACKESIKFSL